YFGGKSLVFPEATATSYVEVIPAKPLNLTAFTLCMRVATELNGKREVILFAYRTTSADELNVWRELDGRYTVHSHLSGDGVYFQLPELGALELHLCVTWDSRTGAAAIYMDGNRSLMKIYKKGHQVQSGGRIILGQDADSFLGDFDAKQSFVGELSDVNMWDSVLPSSTIQDLCSGKRVPRGNIFDWETAELKLNGQVVVITQNDL
uniref:C-reactive protein-like n=1 Tax=Centroberyx gerrardi TaxID=166262 RepID=UPI003AAFF5F3